jgi:hypothetical protein
VAPTAVTVTLLASAAVAADAAVPAANHCLLLASSPSTARHKFCYGCRLGPVMHRGCWGVLRYVAELE